jgi:uncharacterized phage-associated protein
MARTIAFLVWYRRRLLGGRSAAELTALSHKDTPWIVTEQHQPIEYQLAMYRTDATSVREQDDEL